ncbi:sulfurtransferase complex subunit TusB [Pseudomonas cremoricolorata]|uniref:Sulfur relay protein DsrH n=1 Tax=Pseudomonas cremoricolorata TaxID=157783 RepID=A0A089WV28_9PSED|nr:sulfurtransferase complex subunit TusB [Pseudomonas cremoricolorata]AIR90427.1 sulfur relay protein DsrH [Pseudomonas cremoricolorata]
MSTLHVISHSPFADDRLDSCLRLLASDDALLLCGDAVNALRAGSPVEARLRGADLQQRLFVLAEDVQARAIHSELAQALDYIAFVELTLKYDKVNSWL